MKISVLRSLQATVAALAVGAAGFAMAQPAPKGEVPPPPPKHHKHEHKKGHKKHGDRGPRDAGPRDVCAGSSSEREAAAARQADRQGQLSTQGGDQYQANAVARCGVFKVEEDKRACLDRVAKGNVSGSVEGGGVLREFTYTVPAKP